MKTTTRILQLIAIATSLSFLSAPVSAESASEAESATEAEATWMTDFEAAKEKAKSEDKPMLVNFTGSDWCGWCIKLDKEVFSQKAFQDYASENLILVELDFPRRKPQSDELKEQNEALAEKHGIRGFPTILIMDSEGDVLKRTGYRRGGAEAYVEHIKTSLSGDAGGETE